MKRKIKSCIALLLCIAMSLCSVLPAGAVESHETPVVTNNQGSHDYINKDRWTDPNNSFLAPNDDNTLTRVEYTGKRVVVEKYSADFQFISGFSIQPELPLFGGFYSGETHNFLVFGQNNPYEDDSVEVIRIVCYTKDWQRVGSDGLFGANTTIPFRSGSLRFAECDGYLYIRTSHQMYTHDDGLRHQANMMINFRIADTTITESSSDIAYDGMGYVSHSFNQFVAVDGKDLLAVDHGDAYPRSVVLFKYYAPAGQDSFLEEKRVGLFYRCVDEVNVLNIQGYIGNNDTGVAVGGFEVSDSAYLIAGNTVSQEPGCDLFGQRNIFISVTAKDNFSESGTTIEYLTNYTAEDNVKISNPQFAKISSNRFVVLWTEVASYTTTFRYCFVDGEGRLQGQICSAPAVLSDCKPVLVGNRLIWYVTKNYSPAFFFINLDNPENVDHEHRYRYDYQESPTADTDGSLYGWCSVCRQSAPDVVIPALKNAEAYTLSQVTREPTCTSSGYGYFKWKDFSKYNIDNYERSYLYDIPALGHDWVEGNCEIPTTCARCGESQPAPGHNWVGGSCLDVGYSTYTCTICGDSIVVDQSADMGHRYSSAVTKAPGCTSKGVLTYTCDNCGKSYTENIPATGHNYISGKCEGCGRTKSVIFKSSYNYWRDNDMTWTENGYILNIELPSGTHYFKIIKGGAWLGADCEIPDATTIVYDNGCELVENSPNCALIATGGSYTFIFDYDTNKLVVAYDHTHIYDDGKVIEPTPTDKGYTLYTCTTCGHSYVTDEVPALGYTLNGTVTSFLSGDVTVELLKDSQVIASQSSSDMSYGYSFQVEETGAYILRISKENHISIELSVNTESAQPVTDVTLCPIGDVTGDGNVNIKDFQRLLRHVNKTNPLTDYALACGDVTGDGVCNIKDFQRLLRHVNKTNPLF